MTLKEKLNDDVKSAMKSGDRATLGVLRMVLAALGNKEIDLRAKKPDFVATDDVVADVLRSEAKKRKDSILAFEQGGRQDLVAKEKSELAVIEKYLPKQLGREEIEPIIGSIVQKTGSKDFGVVMKEVMKELRGKADSALISELVKEKLQK